MQERENVLKQTLADGRPAFGLWCSLAEALTTDKLDSDAEDLLQQIAEKLAFGASYGKAVAQFDL